MCSNGGLANVWNEYVAPRMHPLRVGTPGRRYSRFDFVTPVADSLGNLHYKTHGTGMRRLVEREARRKEHAMTQNIEQNIGGVGSTDDLLDDLGVDQYSSNVSFHQTSSEFVNALCHGCGTKHPGDIVDGGEGRMLCNKCGAVGSMYFSNEYKDTNETDKSIARADAPKTSGGVGGALRIGKPVHLEASVVPSSTKRKYRVGHAQEASLRASEKETQQMSKSNHRKLTSIIDCIEDLLNDMARVDDKIARKIRMDAESIFRASLEHNLKCGKRECQKALFDKPAGVIARESLMYTIDQIASTGMDGVSAASIVALQHRVRSSQVFNHRDNATQHQSCLAMISSLATTDNSVACPDADIEPDVRSPAKCHASHANVVMRSGIPVRRQSSDVQFSPAVLMRDAIARLSVEYHCEGDIRNAAMFAMQDANFVKQVFADDSIFYDSKKSRSATAHIIMCTVADKLNKLDQVNTEKNLQRVNLAFAEVQSLVEKMSDILPKGAIGSRIVDEEELY